MKPIDPHTNTLPATRRRIMAQLPYEDALEAVREGLVAAQNLN